jgi:BASS family bile acid:Na+ symporter
MSLNYADYEYFLSATLLVCAMFGMGTTLRPQDFLAVARSPQKVLLILGIQVLVTPVLVLVLAKALVLPPDIIVGLFVAAALPGGLFSNIFTYLGKGNVALSVSATAVCTLCCLFTTTFVLRVFGAAQLPPDFTMPVQHILLEIGLCLIVPLMIGMVYRRLFPASAASVAKFCVRASVVMLLLVLVAAVGSGKIDVTDYGWRSPLAIILLQVCLLWSCYGLCKLFQLSFDDTFTVAIEVLVRNSHLGVLLKAALFPADLEANDKIGSAVLYSVLFYGIVCMVVGTGEVIGKRRYWGVYAALRDSEDPPKEVADARDNDLS